MVGKITTNIKNNFVIDEYGMYDSYKKMVRAIPKLSKEQEYEYAIRYYENDDLDACKKILESSLNFVIYIARQYYSPVLSIMDLIQEGNIAMMKSIKKFNPYLGIRFVTFSVSYIRSAILQFVITNSNTFKFSTKSQRKIFFNINSMLEHKSKLSISQAKEIADKTGVSINTALGRMRYALTNIRKMMEQESIKI